MQSSLQQVLVRVERLRSENKELSEKAASLVQEKLNIEQTLQKKKASHEQTLERLRQVQVTVSRQQVQEGSKVVAVVANDVTSLRCQYKQLMGEIAVLEEKILKLKAEGEADDNYMSKVKSDLETLHGLECLLQSNLACLSIEQEELRRVLDRGNVQVSRLQQGILRLTKATKSLAEGNRDEEESFLLKEAANLFRFNTAVISSATEHRVEMDSKVGIAKNTANTVDLKTPQESVSLDVEAFEENVRKISEEIKSDKAESTTQEMIDACQKRLILLTAVRTEIESENVILDEQKTQLEEELKQEPCFTDQLMETGDIIEESVDSI